MKSETGYFYIYRGNGYGPFETEDEALQNFFKRHEDDTWEYKSTIKTNNIKILYGTATTNEQKELISFNRK